MISITQIEYVLAVDKERNFRRAAESCFVTQPTLSAQIQKCEEDLGVILFDRTKSPVTPTRMGELIIEQSRLAYREYQRIKEVVEDEATLIRGELRVGVIPTISPYLLPFFLKSLNQNYPDIELIIQELTTENCLQALDEDKIDVAILATKENLKKYTQVPLYEEKMKLFVNPQHEFSKRKKVKIDELRANEMWLLEEGHCLRDEIIKVCHLSRELNKRPRNLNLQIGNLESIRYLVQENFGYTLLPELSAYRLSPKEKKLIVDLIDPVPTRLVNLTLKRRYLKVKAVNVLKDQILSNLPTDHL